MENFSRPTAANIFVFWFYTFYAVLFIILPHNNSQELKEQKKTKTKKQKVQEQKTTKNTKQGNKTLEQSQYLFPLHFHSHLYFIMPVRIPVLVKVNLNPGLLCFCIL